MADHSTTRRTLIAGTLGSSAFGGLVLASGGTAEAVEIPSDPSVSYFLAIDGIPGESLDERFPDTIDVLDWSWGVTNAISPTNTGHGVGKSKPAPFTFVSRTSVASPKLFLACATGKHIKSATLHGRKSGLAQPFLTIALGNLFVTSYKEAPGPVDAYPLDVVNLEYGAVTISYLQQNADGAGGRTVVAGFDFIKNKTT